MKQLLSLPNAISVLRSVLVVPYIWAFLEYPETLATFILALVIILTDKLDGALARHFQHESRLGEILDAISDNFFIIASWILFYLDGAAPFSIIILIILVRLFHLGSILLYKMRFGVWNTAHMPGGKLAAAIFVAILWILLGLPHAVEMAWASIAVIYIGVIISELARQKIFFKSHSHSHEHYF